MTAVLGPAWNRQVMADTVNYSWMAAGRTAPNPVVGASVYTAGGELVGRGATEAPGGRHAEVVALDEAGERARGGILVASLEPCNHQGRTGPCAMRIIEAGIATVLYGFSDDSVIARGGAETLRQSGISVLHIPDIAQHGPLEPWLHTQRHGRPWVVYKSAITLDGKIAARDGSSQWITSTAARQHAHLRRRYADAIIVGTNTALTDNPSLTARDTEGSLYRRQPQRFVMGLRDVSSIHMMQPHDGLKAATHLATRDPHEALAALGPAQRVILEGGSTVAAAFLHAGLIDAMDLYIAPKIMGSGTTFIHNPHAQSIGDAEDFSVREHYPLGPDMFLHLVTDRHK